MIVSRIEDTCIISLRLKLPCKRLSAMARLPSSKENEMTSMMSFSKEELDEMSEPCTALQEAMKSRPFPDMSGGDEDATLQVVRANRAKHLAGLRHLYPIPGPIPKEVNEVDYTVKAKDGFDIPIRIYTPVKQSGPSPLIILFHEGGWCLGDLTDEDHDARAFSKHLNAVCVNVDYRLAPEHPCPVGLNDCIDILRWSASTASPDDQLLPATPSAGFILGGASAGGNLTAALAQIARDGGLKPAITGQYLAVPGLLAASACPDKWKQYCESQHTSLSDPVINYDRDVPVFIDAMKANPADPHFSPLLHENLDDLPPAYFQVCGVDPLRDEALLYERVLREEHGTKTKLDVYPGYGHMFWTNWPELERSKDFFHDTINGVKWLLDNEGK